MSYDVFRPRRLKELPKGERDEMQFSDNLRQIEEIVYALNDLDKRLMILEPTKELPRVNKVMGLSSTIAPDNGGDNGDDEDDIITGYDTVGSPDIVGNVYTPSAAGFITTPFSFTDTDNWSLYMKVKMPPAAESATNDRTFYGLMQSVNQDNELVYKVHACYTPWYYYSRYYRNFQIWSSTEEVTYWKWNQQSNLQGAAKIDSFLGEDTWLRIGRINGGCIFIWPCTQENYMANNWDASLKGTTASSYGYSGSCKFAFGAGSTKFKGKIYMDSLTLYVNDELYWKAV